MRVPSLYICYFPLLAKNNNNDDWAFQICNATQAAFHSFIHNSGEVLHLQQQQRRRRRQQRRHKKKGKRKKEKKKKKTYVPMTSPVPIAPPMAIIVMCLAFSPRFSSCGNSNSSPGGCSTFSASWNPGFFPPGPSVVPSTEGVRGEWGAAITEFSASLFYTAGGGGVCQSG